MTSPLSPRIRPPAVPAVSGTAARALAALLTLVLPLAGCGGGGGGSSAVTASSGSTGSAAADAIPANYQSYANLCAAPRSGADATGLAFPDKQGTLQDEKTFLRGWIDSTYLWYSEVPGTVHMADYADAISYFNALKTPAITASGKAKDQFHFTYTTAEWDALSNASQDVGYGVTWTADQSTPPRTWRAVIVEPGSPAAAAGIQRGDTLAAIDGVDFVNTATQAGVDALNAGLTPAGAGEAHTLTLQRAGTTFDAKMTSAVVTTTPVKNVKVIDTAAGKVGYLSFEDHNAISEQQLVNAFTTLKSGGATDLVLDMRYNGGGYLDIASELAYMVAGPAAAGKTFEREVYNGKTPDATTPFRSTAWGFSATAGSALPYLGLKRVTVLTTADTCSASEAVINGLRGIDVAVDVIGATTCGKPYGFVPQDNCGTTYFAIQFQGVNAKGAGDYADGMTPTCSATDDLAHALGDPSENLLATALAYRANNNLCPATTATSAAQLRGGAVQPHVVRSQMKEIAIYPKPVR